MIRRLAVLLLCCLSWPCALMAHSLSNSFLQLELDGESLGGHWNIGIRDLAPVLDLDGDGDGAITWREITQRRDDIRRYAGDTLSLGRGGQDCRFDFGTLQAEQLNAGAFIHLPLEGSCPTAAAPLEVDYSLLFEADASHRGYMQLSGGAGTRTHIFSPDAPSANFPMEARSDLAYVVDYLIEGVRHIWFGYDHLLFLLALLLPLFLYRSGGRWVYPAPARAIQWEVLKTVTAFTVAHSITLIVATLWGSGIPAVHVEIFIALTVLLSGVNILLPIFGRWHARVAFAFGLVHGFGFAGALSDLSLPPTLFAGSLLSFNLGVEVGQLVIVLLLFPLLYILRWTVLYRRVAMPALSLAITAAGSLWLLERAAGL